MYCVCIYIYMRAYTVIHTMIYNLGKYDIFTFTLAKITKFHIFKVIETGRLFLRLIDENLGILFL